jgi:hypothetical protein
MCLTVRVWATASSTARGPRKSRWQDRLRQIPVLGSSGDSSPSTGCLPPAIGQLLLADGETASVIGYPLLAHGAWR